MGEAPETIAHFRIVRKLGAGGMGVVYEAVDEKLRRNVAIKVLPPEYSKHEERRSRFLREARSAAAVTHANIATVHEVDEDEGRIYIVMELVEGTTLRRKLDKGALPVRDAVSITKQMAKALARAHEKGVIHRDLKPDNVMITREGDVKLLDFGLAKLREVAAEASETPSILENEETSSHVTQEGRVLGTPGYMSPEQATGKPVDRRTDLFSLGVVLYEMLSGARPFGAGSTMEVIIATSRDDPKPIAELTPQAPPELHAIVNRCLAKAPAERYDAAAVVLEALEAVPLDPSKQDVPAPRASDREVAPAKSVASRTPEGVTPAPAPSAPAAKRSRAPLLAVLIAACALVALAYYKPWSPKPSSVSSPSASASVSAAKPAGTGLADLPKPTACSPEGLRYHEQALEAFRSGGWGAAQRVLAAGVKADPTCPELWLRFALLTHTTEPATRILEVFRTALELRPKMTPRDQALLDALEPLMGRDPPDVGETKQRFDELLEKYPLDAELLSLRVQYAPVTAQQRLELGRRAVAIDPDYADARQTLAAGKIETGDIEGGRAELVECMRRTPAASDCVLERTLLARRLGKCDEMEDVARQLVARDPAAHNAYLMLAHGRASAGAPREVVADALRQFSARLPESRRSEGDHWAALLAVLAGDFDGARVSLAQFAGAIVNDTNLEAHVRHDLVEVELLVEEGQEAAASKAALDFVNRKRSWTRTPKIDINSWGSFGEARLVAFAAKGNALPQDKLRAERQGWTLWAQTAFGETRRWSYGEAPFVESREQALEALATMPPKGAVPLSPPAASALSGRVLWLAGKHAEAIPWLRDATARCEALEHPFENTRAHLWLGQSLEATGDAKAACAPYKVVVDRWGKAKPMSVTAREASARMKAIGCPG